jgi:endoglucanase
MLLAAVALSWRASSERGLVLFGVYDPDKVFSQAGYVSFEHIFLQWQSFDPTEYQSTWRYASARNRRLLVTVEPWTRVQNWRDGGERLIDEITTGRFDNEIKEICHEIRSTPGSVLVRWGHEMEDASGRYPWANRPPGEYIRAYRYFVDHCRQFAPEAGYVWSPKGKRGGERYYPGPDYVDYVGLSLYALKPWDMDHFGRALEFTEVLGWSYSRVASFNKPIIIAEFGVSGDAIYKKKWLRSMSRLKERFDRLFAVIYFNSRETGSWPEPYGSPDWRITPNDLSEVQFGSR